MADPTDDGNRIDGPYDDIVDVDGNVRPNTSIDELLDRAEPPTDAATAAAVRAARRDRPAGDTVDVDLLAEVDARHRDSAAVAAAARADAPIVDDEPADELTAAEAAAAIDVASQADAAGANPVDAVLDAVTPTR